MGVPVLDPLAADRVADRERRVGALEQRPRLVAARATQAKPVPAGLVGWWSIPITSATFIPVWRGVFAGVSHQALFVRCTGIVNGAATTSEYRVAASVDGGPVSYSATAALGAGLSGVPALGWIHNFPISRGTMTVDFEARRTGGANNVSVFTAIMEMMDPQASTVAGAWYAGGWLPYP